MLYQQTGSISNQVIEKINISIAALATTFALLFLMFKLVEIAPPALQKITPVQLPSFTNQIEEDQVIVIKPIKDKLLPKPTNIVTPFDSVDLVINQIDDASNYRYQPETTIGEIPTSGNLVKLTPTIILYPKAALSSGLCGWAVVQFDINESGYVTNASIIDRSHRVFERNSIKSVLKDRYKPMTEGGKPVSVVGKQIRIIYELESGC